jgi:hypothetical protein
VRGVAAAAAATAFAAYFLAWSFGHLDIERGGSGMSREVFYGLTIVLPCLLIGAAIGRWWAVWLLELVFVAALPFGNRCVVEPWSERSMLSCSGIDAADLPTLVGRTLPFLLAGVALRQLTERALFKGSDPIRTVSGGTPPYG